MNNLCKHLHHWANTLRVFGFPFLEVEIPLNGLYILFERGEIGHSGNRIVRIGTHTGQNQLRSRLNQHFQMENKDRSIFRKNIGRALLRKDHDEFLTEWEVDLTSSVARIERSALMDLARRKEVERTVSNYIRQNCTFSVVPIESKSERLRLESRIISTVSRCMECRPSNDWLGLFSPKEKIRKSGLWLVNELYKEPLNRIDLDMLAQLTNRTLSTSEFV